MTEKNSRLDLDQLESRNVVEVLAVERPQGSVVHESAGGNCQVEIATAWTTDRLIESRGEGGFVWAKQNDRTRRQKICL